MTPGLPVGGLPATPNGVAKRVNGRPSFDDFWGTYPRKVAKGYAKTAWDRALKQRKIPPEVILAGSKRLAEDPNLPDKQFIPHPATWIHRGGWDDEPCPPRQQPPPTQQRPQTPTPGSSVWDRKVGEPA